MARRKFPVRKVRVELVDQIRETLKREDLKVRERVQLMATLARLVDRIERALRRPVRRTP